MPPRRKVSKLYQICLDKTLYNVCAVILDEIYFSEDDEWEGFGPPILSPRLVQVRDILANALIPIIEEDLLNVILSKDEAVEATVRYVALQLLLVKGVRNLAIGSFPESYYEFVLEAIATNGEGLQQLDLRGLWAREEHKFYLCKALRRLVNIKRLTLRYNCDDELLAVIGKWCSSVQKLDVAGSSAITEVGLRNLCENPTRLPQQQLIQSLQIINIGGPGAFNLPPSQVSYLLLTLPRLISLGSYERTGAALGILNKRNPEIQFGLFYLHDVYTSSERLHVIIKTCPKLQAIYLDTPKGIAVHHLHLLKHLTEIKLHKVIWSDIQILLENFGHNIRNLSLLKVSGSLDISELSLRCLNLQRLQLHNCSLVCLQPSCPTAFKKTKEILIYNSEINTICAKFIFSHCIGVEHLAIGQCQSLTDAALISILMDKSLQHLKILWLAHAPNLTMRSVHAFLDHCPQLTSLGNLAGWSCNLDELDLLRVEMMMNNADLTFHEFGQEIADDWVAVE